MNLSIVIPVYKSKKILKKLVSEIYRELQFVHEFELIMVNDNSPDNAWLEIVKLKNEYDFIVGINLMVNYSQHNALMAGLSESKGEIVILMDDDLQHSPSDIKLIYDKLLNSEFDICYTKFEKKFHSRWKRYGSKFNDLVAQVLIKKPKDLYLSPFKGLKRLLVDVIVDYRGPFPYIDGLILTSTDRITTISAGHHKRHSGKGNYSFKKSLGLWIKMSTGFSLVPLRMATYIGGIILGLSFIVILLLIAQKFFYNLMPDGWTTITILLIFFGSLQLLSIGLIGEYVGRIYLKLNQKKQYVIREKI
jgi:polyisoprenyl-phosphate glycosyltransferase